jgi:hypothetical protein
MAGVIQRADPRWETVAFLHCEQAEAEQIARDLGARFVKGVPSDDGSDCPMECYHADNWKKYGVSSF